MNETIGYQNTGEKLMKSKRPLLHLGHGVKLSNSQKLIKQFFLIFILRNIFPSFTGLHLF